MKEKERFINLRYNPDFTSTKVWKGTFVIILVGFVIFFILYIFEVVKGRNDCINGTQSNLVCNQPAKYMITWSFDWKKSNNGSLTPDNAQFGIPIGSCGTDASVPFWKSGTIASLGMQDLAGIGDNTELKNEIIQAGQTYFETGFKNIDGLYNVSSTFDVPAKHSFLTLSSKITPSPDWFVGISDVNLCDKEGHWLNMLALPLMPYSAGSDGGNTFTAPTNPLNPVVNINPITGVDFVRLFNGKPVGALSLTRIPVDS